MNDHQAVRQRLKKIVDEIETPDVLEKVLKEPINSVCDDNDNNDKPKKTGIIKRILSLFA